MTGWQSWKQSGSQEHAAGEMEVERAMAQNYIAGTSDRLGGKIDSVAGAILGDRQREISGQFIWVVVTYQPPSDRVYRECSTRFGKAETRTEPTLVLPLCFCTILYTHN